MKKNNREEKIMRIEMTEKKNYEKKTNVGVEEWRRIVKGRRQIRRRTMYREKAKNNNGKKTETKNTREEECQGYVKNAIERRIIEWKQNGEEA